MPDLTPGVAFALSPLVRRIVAVAAEPAVGANTYLIGIDEVAVIDPGPAAAAHAEAIVGCGGDRIRWILTTHGHRGHAEGVTALKDRTGAEVRSFAPGPGVDATLGDGDTIEGTEFRLQVLHTPGHAPDHLCYLLEQERTLFSGDHVATGPVPAVVPPEGDLAAHVEQLRRLGRLRIRALAPGHGDLLPDARSRLGEEVARTEAREHAVVAALAAGPATVDDLVAAVSGEVPIWDGAVARLAVWAHLRKLAAEGRAVGDDLEGTWSPA